MDSKYYEPILEEFYVGFECEFKSYDNDGKGNFIERWDKRVIGLHTFQESYYEQITYNSNWRVKYLDEQDILDLGFEKHSSKDNKYLKSSCEVYSNDKLNITLAHYPEINKISIITRDLSKSELALLSNWDDKSVNLITIKNKSELVKLFKQLEIE